MNQPLKQFLRIGGVVVGLGAAVWALRDKLLPAPAMPDEPPPRFRTGGAGPIVAVGGSSLWFAASHFQPLQFAGLLAFGLVLGLVAHRTGRLGMAICAHIGFNMTTVVVLLAG